MDRLDGQVQQLRLPGLAERERGLPATGLFGRQLELNALRDTYREVLVNGEHRQVVLLGEVGTGKAALVNVIPAQMAGKVARDAGLADQSGWGPINADNMKSAMDANVYVVGDASIAGAMPKSGFSANSQAKVAAMMIRGELAKSRTFPARYTNTCWSLIETDDTVKVGGSYAPKDGKIAATSTFISKTGESAELRKQTQAENMGWYAGITTDIFG